MNGYHLAVCAWHPDATRQQILLDLDDWQTEALDQLLTDEQRQRLDDAVIRHLGQVLATETTRHLEEAP